LIGVALVPAAGCGGSGTHSEMPSVVSVAPPAARPPIETASAPASSSSAAPKAPPDAWPPPPARGAARPRIEKDVLVTAAGERRPAPPGKKWLDVSGNTALLAPADEDASPMTCEVHDARSGALLATVTNGNTAAGGSNGVCSHLDAEGRIVVLTNSRGDYPKKAATDEMVMVCAGVSIFAPDASSCLQIDTSPVSLLGDDPKAEGVPFEIASCDVATESCTTLVKIPRGLNRGSRTRPWDAAYCSRDRIAVLARGTLTIYAPGRTDPVARKSAPSASKVTCADGEARASDAAGKAIVTIAVPLP
jgi:hypothetical protein